MGEGLPRVETLSSELTKQVSRGRTAQAGENRQQERGTRRWTWLGDRMSEGMAGRMVLSQGICTVQVKHPAG